MMPSPKSFSVSETHVEADDTPRDEHLVFASELDRWTLMLRNAVLADFELSRGRDARRHQLDVEAMRAAHETSLAAVHAQLEAMRAARDHSDKKLENHNKLVNAVTIYLTHKRKRIMAVRWFAFWRMRVAESQRERVAMRMARFHFARTLLRKTVLAWYRVAGTTWRKATEKRLRIEAEKHMHLMSLEYEKQISELQSKLNRVSMQLQDVREAQVRQQEDMKRSFLRGVCALNMEAMGIFRTGAQAQDLHDTLNQSRVDTNMDRIVHGSAALPVEASIGGSASSLPVTERYAVAHGHPAVQGVRFTEPAHQFPNSRTQGLVTRHFG
nr:Centrosomal protein poc5 [Polyrhizophydium stewartii]